MIPVSPPLVGLRSSLVCVSGMPPNVHRRLVSYLLNNFIPCRLTVPHIVPSLLTVLQPSDSANSEVPIPPADGQTNPNPFTLTANTGVVPPVVPPALPSARAEDLPAVVVTGKRPRSSRGRSKSRVVSRAYVEIEDKEKAVVKGEVVEPQLSTPPPRKRREKTADSDRKTRRYPHNIDRPPFPHNGTVPPPGSDLRNDMLTCDNCWKKRQTNPGLECILVPGRRVCLRCREAKVKCSRCPDDWVKHRTTLTEEEELDWMISGRLPEMSSVPQGTGPSQRSRGPSRKRSPSTARPRSKSRGEGKSKGGSTEKSKGKSKEKAKEKSRAPTSRNVKAKAQKSKIFRGSEDEDEDGLEYVEGEVMEHVDARSVKRPRTDAGPSRGPTMWIAGGRKVHAGPSPPEPVIRQLQSQQAKMETRLDVIDSHFATSTAIQQQMLEALQRMSLSLQRLDARPSSSAPSPTNAPQAVPVTRRLQHLEASNNALFAAVNGLRESSGSQSDSTPPNVCPPLPSTTGESLGPSRVPSLPPLRIRPRLTPDRRVVAEVQTSPLPDTPMIVDIPRSAIGVQTTPPISPVRLAQGMQTIFNNVSIPTVSVAVQAPSTPSLPQGIRLDVEIQTDVTMNTPLTPPSPSTPVQATQVEQDGSHPGGFGFSPLTSLSTFDLLPPSSSLPASQSQESSVSPLPPSPTPA